MLGPALASQNHTLIGREITFQVFQPVWSGYLNVTHVQTTYHGI